MHAEVLVAIMNKRLDFVTAHEQQWYRIPVSSAEKWLRHRWLPQYLAFYQTAIFGAEQYAINYYARVHTIRTVYRWQLFPNEPRDARSERQYYQLCFAPLQRLPQPIVSHRRRRILFIPTTWAKFTIASEINDLYDDSPLEDRLWTELKRWNIQAERQEFGTINQHQDALDFTIRCAQGKIAVETDGDTWHANAAQAAKDYGRDNALQGAGWRVVRFNTAQIQEHAADYCLQTIKNVVNQLGGLDEGGVLPRRLAPHAPDGMYQPGLFDGL